MKLLTTLFLALPLAAQLSPEAATVRPGETVNVKLNTATPGASGFQWRFVPPTGWSVVGQSSARSDKQMACKPGNLTCFVLGMDPVNKSVIPVGQFAAVQLTVPPTAAPGAYNVSLANVFAVDPNGGAITVAGGSAVLTINPPPSPYDLTGDGRVDKQDVLAAAQRYATDGSCGFSGISSGPCTFLDVVAVWLEAVKQAGL